MANHSNPRPNSPPKSQPRITIKRLGDLRESVENCRFVAYIQICLGTRGTVYCLFIVCLLCLFVCLFVCLFGRLVAFLLVWLVGSLIPCLFGRLVGCLIPCLFENTRIHFALSSSRTSSCMYVSIHEYVYKYIYIYIHICGLLSTLTDKIIFGFTSWCFIKQPCAVSLDVFAAEGICQSVDGSHGLVSEILQGFNEAPEAKYRL